MEELSSTQRKYLRGQAHSVKPVVQVGKNGLSDEILAAVEENLNAHELIKVKFVECKDQKKEISAEIASRAKAELAGLIGNIAIIYRQHPEADKRHIKLP